MVSLIIDPVYTLYSGSSISCIFKCWIPCLWAYDSQDHYFSFIVLLANMKLNPLPLCSNTKCCVKLRHMEPSTIPRDRWTANPIKQQHHSPIPTERRKRMQTEQLHSCKHFDGILPGKMGGMFHYYVTLPEGTRFERFSRGTRIKSNHSINVRWHHPSIQISQPKNHGWERLVHWYQMSCSQNKHLFLSRVFQNQVVLHNLSKFLASRQTARWVDDCSVFSKKSCMQPNGKFLRMSQKLVEHPFHGPLYASTTWGWNQIFKLLPITSNFSITTTPQMSFRRQKICSAWYDFTVSPHQVAFLKSGASHWRNTNGKWYENHPLTKPNTNKQRLTPLGQASSWQGMTVVTRDASTYNAYIHTISHYACSLGSS